MVDLIIFVVAIVGSYLVGTKLIEHNHYTSIKDRERQFLRLPAITFIDIDSNRPIKEARLVCGGVVVSIDYFKRFLAGLKNIFGGEITSCETIVDRARREAILRMKEKAPQADIIVNLRIETSTIGNTSAKNQITCSEVVAYGTAITFA